MKKDNWIWYSIYALVLSCYMIFSIKILMFLSKQMAITFNGLPLMIWPMIIFIVFGLLLGLDKLLMERRKEGIWKVNLPKFLLLGIPLLYFSIGEFIFYCPIDFIRKALSYLIILILKSDINVIPVFQVVLGFVISTSFIKINE